MSSQLPPYAKQWAQQWKHAAPALQAIRDEELRRLDQRDGSQRQPGDEVPQAGQSVVPQLYDRYPERHGMVIMQRWFMRLALLSSTASRNE